MAQKQIPLPLRGTEEAVFAQLVGEANLAAVEMLRSMARAEIANSGYLSGGAGCGKTHALFAACRQAQDAGRRAGYVSAEQLLNQGRASLESLDGFDFLALDDLERLLGSADWEEGLFHCLNRWRAGGVQLLIAAAIPARRLSLSLADLGSRLCAMTDIRLQPLADDGERAELLLRRALARGMVLNDEVVRYLLRRQQRSPAALIGLLDRLTQASLAEQRRITVPFVKALFAGEPPP